MKKFFVQISLFAMVVTILVFYYIYLNISWRDTETLNKAQVARMLVALKYDMDVCEKDMTESDFPAKDISSDTWYAKYVAIVLKEGWLQLNETGEFEPGKRFSYGDLGQIMSVFGLTEDMLSFSLNYHQEDAFVSKKQWCEVYKLLAVHQKNIEQTERMICATPTTDLELEPWEVETNDGRKKAEGLALDQYMHQKVEVLEKQGHILCVVNVMEREEETEVYETRDDANIKNVRVLLQSGNQDYEHNDIRITSDESFYIQSNNKRWSFNAGQVVEVNKDSSFWENDEITFRTENKDGKIRVLSLEKSCGNPEYKGGIYLKKSNDGIWMINEVNMEDYVAGVISSEMPSVCGIEALKAQAVCVRTYALKAMEKGFSFYPADVDDTVASQVYNNQPVSLESIKAAELTKNQVLQDANGITSVWFFSTSCGRTSQPNDIWYDGTEKESEPFSVAAVNDQAVVNTLSEEKFRTFINLVSSENYYEEDLPWFRWQVYIDSSSIEKSLEDIRGIKIGDLEYASVTERGKSGVAKALYVEGSLDSCMIYGEYQIRQILTPAQSEVMQQDGNRITQMNMLPSGYFYMDPLVENGLCQGYLIHGGGYGHGCGMSQNGAMKMAEKGKNYIEILSEYFPNTSLVTR